MGPVTEALSSASHARQPAALLPVAQRTNPERSFTAEVRALRLGDGEICPRARGILPSPRAILQSGVPMSAAIRARPFSHLVDVLVESQDLLDELGVHLETAPTNSSAARFLVPRSTSVLRRLCHLEVDRRDQRGRRRAQQPRIARRNRRRP